MVHVALRRGGPLNGHFVIALAHLNLKDEYLPYKYIIGQVILDVCARIHIRLFGGLMGMIQKNKGIKTVVNKLDSIDAKFRFFKMELLAGEPNYVVEHVGFDIVPAAFAPLTSTRRSMNRTAYLRSTSQRCIGTLGYIPSTKGWFSYSAHMTSLRTCSLGSDPSLSRRRRKGVGCLPMT